MFLLALGVFDISKNNYKNKDIHKVKIILWHSQHYRPQEKCVKLVTGK